MRIGRPEPGVFLIELENEAELDREERAHLAMGGLLLPGVGALPALTRVEVILRLVGGGELRLAAQVVATLPGALALQIDGDPAAHLAALRTPSGGAAGDEPDEAVRQSLWERLRNLTPPQKVLLAPKADRVTRALLVQESDPQVLFALLKNPRLSIDEVVRVAKSSFLSFQAAELILKTSPWFSNLDVRLALIQNAKTPLPFALRILPTLPDHEIRAIAKGAATSMALKQAALRKLHGG